MTGQFSARLRRFARNSEGATIIEFALIFPIVLMITFGIMEVSLCMASLVTLEGGLKEASRYGITAQTPTKQQILDLHKPIPTYFNDPNNPRLQMIGIILDENTLNLIDLNDAKPTTKIYSSFSAVKNGEPYNDLPDIPHVGDPPNGQYDGPGTTGAPAGGEPIPT